MNYGVLFELEKQLLDPAARRDCATLERLLDEAFFEFGASGKIWNRQAIIEALTMEPVPAVEAYDFRAHELAQDVVLVTYKTSRGDQAAIRSSIWRNRDGNWKIFFHQGTKLDCS